MEEIACGGLAHCVRVRDRRRMKAEVKMIRSLHSKEFAFAAICCAALTVNSLGATPNRMQEIQLSTIVTTSPQKGLLNVENELKQEQDDRRRKAATADLRRINSSPNGASNIFLVEAGSICDAVSASAGILAGLRTADTPALTNSVSPSLGRHWLVAYLGTGPSTPTWWSVERVDAETNKLKLTYRKAPPSPVTSDEHSYLFWVPLEHLAPGTYQLELYDAERDGASLVRRVDVE